MEEKSIEELKYGKSADDMVSAKGTSRKRCDCYHPFQDNRYGPGIRVHNKRATGGWTCTVCGQKKS